MSIIPNNVLRTRLFFLAWLIQMQPPRKIFENSTVVAYVVVPESAVFTGALYLYVDGQRLGRVPRLAIALPDDEPGLHLLHCDSAWNVLGIQAWNAPDVGRILSVEDMITQAGRYYTGIEDHWVITENV